MSPSLKSGRERGRPGVVAATVVVTLLCVAGAGYTMKVTDSRPFCGSCHVMAEAALTHKMSTHAKLACNECHTPASLPEKLPYKTKSGISDVTKNTFGKPADVIHAGLDTKAVVNANCGNCHTMSNIDVASLDVKKQCTDCHASVHHLRKIPISKRMVGDE